MSRKIVVVLLFAALAMLVAPLAYNAPVIHTRIVMTSEAKSGPSAVAPFMYAGIRG
jgi:hypothetical protein